MKLIYNKSTKTFSGDTGIKYVVYGDNSKVYLGTGSDYRPGKHELIGEYTTLDGAINSFLKHAYDCTLTRKQIKSDLDRYHKISCMANW